MCNKRHSAPKQGGKHMTRNEFVTDVTTFWELRDFCEENNMYTYFDEIYDSDYLDELLNDRLREGFWDDWRTAKSDLDDIPEGYDYYRDGLTYDDFDDLKADVLSEADDLDLWDEDEPDEEDDEEDVIDQANWMDALMSA